MGADSGYMIGIRPANTVSNLSNYPSVHGRETEGYYLLPTNGELFLLIDLGEDTFLQLQFFNQYSPSYERIRRQINGDLNFRPASPWKDMGMSGTIRLVLRWPTMLCNLFCQISFQ